jgi:outer membrane protein OmpA-like peptidoglycan-associated protein
VIVSKKDSLLRIVGLEPFSDYTLTLDESNFQQLSWKLPYKTIQFTADPNQFKRISMAIQPMGEISGMVVNQSGRGLGRVIVNLFETAGKQVGRVLTEEDGYFTYIGFKPGTYLVGIDSTQLRILKMTCEPVRVAVKPDVLGDVVDAGTLIMKAIQDTATNKPIVSTTVDSTFLEAERLLRYYVLFDSNKTAIRTEYVGPLSELACFLTAHPDFKVEIVGHTDADGSSQYNQQLSERRAEAVKRFLISRKVEPSQLITIGMGESRLLNASRTPEEKAVNRRVEFEHGTPEQAIQSAVTLKEQMGQTIERENEQIMLRKETHDMIIMVLTDSRFMIQFGAYKSPASARKLADRLISLVGDRIQVVFDRGLYKVQTKPISSYWKKRTGS